jgi:hypothetical protein
MMPSNWRHKITIKHLFEKETTPELIVTLCEALTSQLSNLISKEEDDGLVTVLREDYKNYVFGELEDIMGGLEFLQDLASGEIKESEWEDFSFDGNFEEMFNSLLEALYDLGDVKVETTNGYKNKFLWIG